MEASGHVWRFASCEFDELRRELRVRGQVVDVESKPLDVLHQLLLHAGEVVTKDELLESAWPGLTVVDSSLATAVSKLRKALDDESIVVTVSRVGYRLGVPVRRAAAPPPEWPELQLRPGDPVPGRDQWRLSRRLDLSPSSDVWLAEHAKTREARVFKFAPDAARLRNLKREVTLARLLRESFGERPDFVRILEWNFASPPYFVESAYVGPDLAEWAEGQGGLGAVPLALRLRLFADIARAVADAHALDVLHKDLKPGNVLIAPRDGVPQIVVSDFGSAALMAPERLQALGITNLGFTQPATGASALTGTVLYLAPEVMAGQAPSAASDVYSLAVLLYQMAVGDFRRPLAPGWENDVADLEIREDIALAASGDPARRRVTAAQLAVRVSSLDQRRAERTRRARARARRPWLLLAGASALALMAAAIGLPGLPARAPAVKTLAVLPFENTAADAGLDFLSVALPEEIATSLMRAGGLAVYPFSRTSRYDPGADLERASRDLGVDGLVTGRFVRVGSQLHVTIEAMDATTTQVVWRDAIDAPADSLVAAQVQLALRVRGGLVPAFGATTLQAAATPGNEEAYALFLRSMALPFETVPNPQGIAMLEKAVALDPTYPPAWVALARRYYVEARYVRGDSGLMKRYEAAMERAVALDPGHSAPAAGLIVSRVERGDLVGAGAQARDLVRRHPNSADAHFAMSYVLRFAGLLREAGEQCDQALLLDPRSTTSGLRSCAIVFFRRGEYARALNYQQLYLGSDWARAFALDILVRQGRREEAVRVGPPRIPQYRSYDLLAACAAASPASEIQALAAAVEPSEDPESNYLAAAHLAYCGQTAAALDLLRRAIARGYCAYPSLDADPLLTSIRSVPEFAELRVSGATCQRTFLAQRNSAAAAPATRVYERR